MRNNSLYKKYLLTMWRAAAAAVVGLLTLTFLGACQGSKSKSAPNPNPLLPPNYYNGNYSGALCPTCNMNVAWTIFAGTDSQSGFGNVSLSLDFYGDPATGYNFYDPKIPVMYSGPVVVRGQLTINTMDSLICNAPPGQYQLISLSPGQWQSGVLSSTYGSYGPGPTSLVMDAVSPFGVNLRLRLAKAIIYNPSGTNSWHPNSLGGTLVFESINGAPCVAAYTELY